MAKTRFPDRVSCADAARAFGVSRQAVAQWKGAPKNEDGTYHLPKLIAWRVEQVRLQLVDADLQGDSPALERLREAKADLAELDLAQRQQQVVLVEDMREQVRHAFVAFKRHGETLRRLAPDLAPDFIKCIEDARAKLGMKNGRA